MSYSNRSTQVKDTGGMKPTSFRNSEKNSFVTDKSKTIKQYTTILFLRKEKPEA